MQLSWVRQKREELGISQYKMAKAIGVSNAFLSALERGKRPVETDEVNLLNDFFNNHQVYFHRNGVKLEKRKFQRDFIEAETLKETERQKITENFYKKNPWPKVSIDRGLKALMLFSGIGGMSLGFKKAGYRIIGHVEIEESANAIYAKNFPDSKCFGTDIRKVTDQQLKEIKKGYGEIDVIAGGPPCQGFSLAGKRNVLDPRNELFHEFARFAKILKPRAILLENVRTLLSMQTKEGKPLKDLLVQTFDDAGYNLIYKPVNAKEYGVPQSRERVVFIGLRKDLVKEKKFEFPLRLCGDSDENLFEKKTLLPYKSFRQASLGLDLLESGEYSKVDPWHFAIRHPRHVIEMLKSTPEGKSAHENTDHSLRPRSGYNTTYKRIHWDEPSSTISTNFSMISGSRNVHPKNTRSLTIREAMRCQTFPDHFLLEGTLGDIRKGIGNAVPPLLAEVFAKHLKNYTRSLSA